MRALPKLEQQLGRARVRGRCMGCDAAHDGVCCACLSQLDAIAQALRVSGGCSSFECRARHTQVLVTVLSCPTLSTELIGCGFVYSWLASGDFLGQLVWVRHSGVQCSSIAPHNIKSSHFLNVNEVWETARQVGCGAPAGGQLQLLQVQGLVGL